MKTLNIDEEKNFLLLKDLRNVNDIFSKNVTYNNIKSRRKTSFSITLRKITRGCKNYPHPHPHIQLFLLLKTPRP